jgi:putative transposase
MPKPYSVDLRKRVLAYLEVNNDKRSAAEIFKVGIATIYRWIVRKKEKGHIQPTQRKYAYKKIDDQKLIDYVETYPDHFLSEIADHFCMTPAGIFRALKRLKITRKKRLRFTRKEERRQENSFLRNLN